MARRGFASANVAKVSAALLLRSVEYGESDVIATMFTELEGKVAVIVRGARKGSRRVSGALEPFHSIELTYEDRRGDLGVLKEARVLQVRARLTGSLDAMQAAGQALRWARHLCPARTPEPDAWQELVALLDALDEGVGDPLALLAGAGLRLLGHVGYALEFERCVVCGALCPPGRAGTLDPARGGLVCRACGGASVAISAELRAVAAAVQRGQVPTKAQASAISAIVTRAMLTHAEYEA